MLYPYLQSVLIAVAYGLMLPLVAVLHVQHRRVRDSGAILATIAGTAVIAMGLVGSVNVDLRPAALFLLGMWWWTIGKMWAETHHFGRYLGLGTAALGVLALVAAFAEAASVLSALLPGLPWLDVWTLARVALGAWLAVMTFELGRVAR